MGDDDGWGDRKKLYPPGLPAQIDKRDDRSGLPTKFGDLPRPPAPLGSTWLGTAKWKAVSRLLVAYKGAIDAATDATDALDALDMAKFRRQQTGAFLQDAPNAHAHDQRERDRKYQRSIDDLEEVQLQSRKRARQREREEMEDRERHEAWLRSRNSSSQNTSPSGQKPPYERMQADGETAAIREYEVDEFLRRELGGISEADLPPDIKDAVRQLREVLKQVNDLRNPPQQVREFIDKLRAAMRS